MTNITFNKEDFESYVTLTDEVIEKISLFGTPLERISDTEVEIEVFPNRPDLLSLQGFMRGFLAFLGKRDHLGLKKYDINKSDETYAVTIDQAVKNVRPYTACAIVKNIQFTDDRIAELIRLQEKIHLTTGRNRKKAAIGIYPLEHITLPITFTAQKPEDIVFRPLESDQEMNAREILKDHPTGKEYAHLLEHADVFPVFLDANNQILSIPPIINSHDTGRITTTTRDVFIECSGFDRRILSKVLTIITSTLAEMNGAIYQMTITDGTDRYTTPNFSEESKKIDIDHVNTLLGLTITDDELPQYLARMGYRYDAKSKQVAIPPWRTDIFHEVDIIEDIAISYGYDKITPTIPNVATVGQESELSKKRTALASLLTGLGYQETLTYHLLKQDEKQLIPKNHIIELEDSKTEYKYLRESLLIPALRILSENTHNEYPQDIFEMGTVFIPDKREETGVREEEHLIVLSVPGNFTKAKQVLDYLTRMRSQSISLTEAEHPLTIPGRTGYIKDEDEIVGFIGEIHPFVLSKKGIDVPVSVFEIRIDKTL